MKKADRLKLEEATYYRVAKAFGATGDVYEVRRFVDGKPEGLYYVTLNPGQVVWCDCPGFKHQKFAHMDHKHVKLVAHFQMLELADTILDIEPPMWAKYKIKGTGANTTIHHQLTIWKDEHA